MLANVSRGAKKAVIKDFEERVELPLELAAAVLFLSRECIERVQCEMFIYAEAALNNVAHAASGGMRPGARRRLPANLVRR